MKLQALKAVSLVLIVFQTGCATIFHGTTDQISITSRERGTKIFVDEREIGEDSAIAVVPKRGSHSIRVSKEGCSDVVAPIPYSFDGVSLLGILLDFGIISMLIVDTAATGAITKADQTHFILTPNCGNRRQAQIKLNTVEQWAGLAAR